MTLKLGPIPDRTPVKITLSLAPDVHRGLAEYAELHAQTYRQEAPLADLAAMMIEEFLEADAGFKRARKTSRLQKNGKE
ncbi:MAG: DUF2274 domain-containing protein [Amphiplicatus sp.]